MQQNDLSRIDPGDMYGAVRGFPDDLRSARLRAAEVDPGSPLDGARNVIISGMGGSAISGDLLAALAGHGARVPIVVSRSYNLPGFADETSLVIVSSYSGNTEETLSAMDEAQARGCRILAISAGGSVSDRARSAAVPLYVLPGGMQPRAALGHSLATLLTLAEQIGLLSIGDEAWEETYTILADHGADFQNLDTNPAHDLAVMLRDRLPFVYAGNQLLAPVATRWSCQIEENAKMLAHASVFPEQNHNEIVGWEVAAPVQEYITVVGLRDHMDHPQVVRRLDRTRDLLQERGVTWIDVHSRGASALARMLSVVQLGDWVSLYLALLRGVDPTPVNLIQRLKQSL